MQTWPDLPLGDWRPTRDALQHVAKVMGAIRAANTPAHPHWWHAALQVAPTGIRTGPVPSGGDGQPFEIEFDLGACTFGVESDEDLEYLDLDERIYDVDALTTWAAAQIELGDGKVKPDTSKLDGKAEVEIDEDDAERFGVVLNAAHGVLVELAHTIPTGFCGPVLLWPHHFDLAMSWFTGRQVAGADPSNREAADESMTFGFSTGDEGLPEPYFYVIANPFPDGLEAAPLPHGAAWQTEPFRGIAWPYARCRSLKNPHAAALKVFRAAQQAGAAKLG